VRKLIARGVDAVAVPLIEIEAPLDPQPVDDAWQSLSGRGLAVFVSSNAVARFFAARPTAAAWPEAGNGSFPRDGLPVAPAAHLGITLPQLVRVKARTVGIE